MKRLLLSFLRAQQAGLILIILLLGLVVTLLAGSHEVGGRTVNNFLNANVIVSTVKDAAVFAIMAVGVTMVIISGGIDLSVGSIYALVGVLMAMLLRSIGETSTASGIAIALFASLALGAACGLVNGLMVIGLRVHPFIVTLGTMLIFRGIAFVASGAESIGIPVNVMNVAKLSLGLDKSVHPVPALVMLVVTIIGELYLLGTVMGRNIYAVGGNPEAARYCGLRLGRTLVSVYAISGLTAGIAALVGVTYYGSGSCNDGQSYELYVIASAVVGGASLMGGKGSAVSAMLGAVLIALIKQSITTLHMEENYQQMIVGCAIIIAVVLDRVNAQMAAKRMAAIARKT